MLRLILISVLVALATARSFLSQGRISNGDGTSIEKLPYQVSIQLYSAHKCGGIILSTNAILTSARCVYGVSSSFLSIRVGSSYINAGGEVHQIRDIFRHPSYSLSSNDYDVAILTVKKNLTISSTVQTIPVVSVQPNAEVLATISGYGDNQSGNNGQLRQLQVSTVGRAACRAQYGSSVITDRMICAGTNVEISQGDIGGALVYNGAVIGISSWGQAFNAPNYATVFTDVTESSVRELIRTRAGI